MSDIQKMAIEKKSQEAAQKHYQKKMIEMVTALNEAN